MKENFIQIEEQDKLRLEIVRKNGESTNNYLEFDLENIELLLTFQKMIDEEKKNRQNLKNQMIIIDKREDHKGKKLLSYNEEAKIMAIRDFFKKEEEIYNMFLGDNGVSKLLDGRKLGWDSLEIINKIIKEQIAPKLDIKMENITKKIKDKYSILEDESVLE